jgi:hypothetical protein
VPHSASSAPSVPPSQAQQNAFDEHRPQDGEAARPQRQAHADFLPPGGGARQQQVGEVGTGDQQHQPHHRHQHQQRLGGFLTQAGRAFAAGMDLDPLVQDFTPPFGGEVRPGQGFQVLLEDDADVGLRLPDRHARLEPRSDVQPHDLLGAARIVAQPLPAGLHQRLHHHGEIYRRGRPDRLAEKPGRQDADDGEPGLARGERAAEHRGVAVETVAPEVVAQDGVGVGAGRSVLGGVEGAADQRAHAESFEVAA